jgi:hypothetical protein
VTPSKQAHNTAQQGLIRFGYDKNPKIHARGYARSDWSLSAWEDSRGFGWQVVTLRGDRSRHMSLARAIDVLLADN